MSANQTALDEVQKCIKRQKTCASKTDAALDSLISMVKAAQEELERSAPGADAEGTIARLHKSIEEAGLLKDINSSTKEFHTAISKFGKALEKAVDLDTDLCRCLRPCPAASSDPSLLARLLAEHAYRCGAFGLGDTLVGEAGLMDADQLRAPHAAVHEVLQQIRARNLAPALQWAAEHRPQLSPDGGPSDFEFRLHSLQFVHTLKTQGRGAALAYAKAHFAPHAARHLHHIQRLMGCLIFVDRTVSTAAGGTASTSASTSSAATNPYADLLCPSGWDAAAREFAKQACSLFGQASESPLTTVVAAGGVALPALLKMADKMEAQKQDLRSVDELPVEIQLGPSFVFRSIFACPVSRDMARPDNPPTLLPCGHVLCQQSCALLARGRGRGFKCPYCPMEARLDALRPLTFPGLD
ncbi:hypothetical protein GPECTOR_17g842 [Gonium pectorale]|uniref:RING-Gid-type domain-containing protein n=1 Tax=Gonium pectorale TaxID=33097 RepID=A0A150GKG5_GONPE|nr:hypothetical protein GPECTOR_17g842 [Gonium pectorale]|eukprot:KXZ50205.1 hypothetical protein GPECTOR_17g842 [Gonium pectorale]